jgi:myo-inositol 2-dehydrogenase/D-chiro-inositol 1-dehydrogenase
MEIGLAGAGRMGALHAHVLVAHPAVRRLVVTDTDAQRAQALAGEVSAAASERVLVEVAESPEACAASGVQAVVIAAATPAHAPLIELAAAHGLATFCEKPIALDLGGTDRALAAAEEAGIYLQIGFNRRFDEGFVAARRAVADGTVGQLRMVRMGTHDPAPPPLGYLAESGGVFRDMHIHDFDALRFVTGEEVAEVFAAGAQLVPDGTAVETDVDTAALVLRLASGALVVCSGCRADPRGYDVRLELFGSDDSLTIGIEPRAPLRSIDAAGLLGGDAGWEFYIDRFADAYRAQIATFVDNVESGADSPCTGRDARAALLIAMAAERSLAEGRPVSVAAPAPV